jgi:hypothetical protein
MRNLIRAFSVIGLLLLSGCGLLPSRALPIEAWVVDAETKQPLENVVVFIEWRKYTKNFIHSTGTGTFFVQEAITNHNGYFYFPSWEPRYVSGGVTSTSPIFTFFKEGYQVLRIAEPAGGIIRNDSPSDLKSTWNSQVIPLQKFNGNQEEYEKQILALDKSVTYAAGLSCLWEKIPRTIAFLLKTNKGNVKYFKQSAMEERRITMEYLNELALFDAKKYGTSCSQPTFTLKEYF